MWYFLIVILAVSSYVDSSSIDSFSSASQSSRHKRNEEDEGEPWKNPYLRNTIEPIRYTLFISPRYHYNGIKFFGNVSIEVKIHNRTKTVIVHKKKQLNVVDRRVYDMSGEDISQSSHFDYEDNDYYVMQTREFLPDKAKLTFNFEGNMTFVKNATFTRSGLYTIPYFDVKENGKQSWLVVSDFRPSYARYVFPCFDEPQFKAKFRIIVEHWETYTSLSNMPAERFEHPAGSSFKTIFKESPKMSSYQVAFAVTNFGFKNKTVNGKQLSVWAQSANLEKADYALNVTPTIQNYLQQELDMPYSLEKLDQIAVLGELFTGQRENWGLVNYKESKILVDETKGGDFARKEALKLISHALAHSYFGNLVTCRYWNHVWLNEGLATFYEIRAVTEVDPTLLYKEFFFGKKVESAMIVDAGNLTGSSLVLPSEPSKVVEPSFCFLRRDKGAAVIRMVENVVGADPFRNGIRRYLKENANGTVVTDHLWDALQMEITNHLDIKKIMKNWVERSGLPVIKVELLPGNEINATQKQFLEDPLAIPDQTNKWYVPLTYRTKGNTEQVVWMNETDVRFPISLQSSDDWIEFNPDRTGYYRVNYDAILWDRIVKQLNENHTVFTELSRSKLLSDAVALAKAEQLGYDVFLNLTRYASKEKSLTPWFHIIDGFNEFTIIYNTTSFCCLKNYILNLTSNLMNTLQVKDEGSYIEKQLRPKIMSLSCSSGHRGCIENTTRLFKAWIENDQTNAVPKDYLPVVYCIGISNSSLESDWNTTVERYRRSTSAVEKAHLLKALSCTGNVTLLERLLDYSLDTTFVRDGESYVVIAMVAVNPSSDNCAWKWLKRKHEEIDQLKGCGVAGTFLPHAVQAFNTREQYQEVVDFYDVYPDVSEENRNLAKNYIDYNIHWVDRNFATFANCFETNVQS